MKSKIIIAAIAIGMCMFSACAGNNPPKQQTDTVDKADVTKDTLGIDTSKSINKDSSLIKKDTSKKVKAK